MFLGNEFVVDGPAEAEAAGAKLGTNSLASGFNLNPDSFDDEFFSQIKERDII